MSHDLMKITFGVIATVGLYSVLYRENKFYRLCEHIFLGLASGYTIVILWKEILKPNWVDAMLGVGATATDPAKDAMWAFVFLLPIGLMGYFVFSQKHNWISRIPIGVILGLFATEQFAVFFNRYGTQIADSMRPILPTTWDSLRKPGTSGLTPEQIADINAQVYFTQALSNLIYVVTLLSVLAYFLFSFELKSKFLQRFTTLGRWLLMIGFGAIFGSTVMMRFSLLIDRMYFIWIEFLRDGLPQLFQR
jgi:hypothetical protein